MGMKTLSWKQEGWMKEDSEKFMLIICQKLISKEPPSPHQSQNLQLKEETEQPKDLIPRPHCQTIQEEQKLQKLMKVLRELTLPLHPCGRNCRTEEVFL